MKIHYLWIRQFDLWWKNGGREKKDRAALIGSQRSRPWQDSIDHLDNFTDEKIRIRHSSISGSPVHSLPASPASLTCLCRLYSAEKHSQTHTHIQHLFSSNNQPYSIHMNQDCVRTKVHCKYKSYIITSLEKIILIMLNVFFLLKKEYKEWTQKNSSNSMINVWLHAGGCRLETSGRVGDGC